MQRTIALFVFILLCGCELTLEVDIPHDKESLVVNSIFAADSLWQVSVSYDRAILDTHPFKIVEDADVVIYDESGPVETLKLNNQESYYRSAANKPVPGKRYEIRVSAPGHDPVSAFAYTPRATEIVSVKTRDTFINDHPATAFDITIQDDPSVENYYRVFVATESYNFYPNTNAPTLFYSRMSLESDDPLLADENNLSEGGVLIKDALFNGKEAKLSVKMLQYGNGNDYGKIRVNVETLSREAYDYFITSQLQYNTSDDPLAQPVKVFNNVEGGFGIFAGYNQSTAYLQDSPGPVITSITPMSGHINDEVIIEGDNFSVYPWEVSVIFKGTNGFSWTGVIESTPTRIRCRVPILAITGPITVLIRGQAVTSKENFTVNN